MLRIKHIDNLKIENRNGAPHIFCALRKKWLKLTPEEWVRQQTINFLVTEMELPQKLIAAERQINVGQTTKRFDLVVYGQNTKPWLIVECKEPDIELSPSVVEQVLRYNIIVNAPYIAITNGFDLLIFEKNASQLIELADFPAYK